MSSSTIGSYPRYCAECGEECVQPVRIQYNAEVKHDGKLHSFVVDDLPVDECGNCHEQWFTQETEDAIQDGLRTHLCLLRPVDIRQRLNDLSLSQSSFATRIGVAPESISRWLNGHTIQNRAMDNLMRAFFGLESVRESLTENGPIEGLGVVERPVRARMSWVMTRDFSLQVTKRSESFQLRIHSDERNVR